MSMSTFIIYKLNHFLLIERMLMLSRMYDVRFVDPSTLRVAQIHFDTFWYTF